MNITIEDEGREIADIQSEYIAGLKELLAEAHAYIMLGLRPNGEVLDKIAAVVNDTGGKG